MSVEKVFRHHLQVLVLLEREEDRLVLRIEQDLLAELGFLGEAINGEPALGAQFLSVSA